VVEADHGAHKKTTRLVFYRDASSEKFCVVVIEKLTTER
jgi:hypothetical protein